MTRPPEASEGADAALDDMIADVNAWVGQIREMAIKARRTANLCRGTTNEAKADAILRALNGPMGLPRILTGLKTRAQLARDTASARATSDDVGVFLDLEAEQTRRRA